MSKIEIKILGKQKLIRNLLARSIKFRKKVRMEFIFGGDEFITLIRAKWYSGRRADDTGLNRQTSMLYNTWRSEVIDSGNEIKAVIANGTNYAILHEEKRPFRGPTRVVLPPRTDIIGDMTGKRAPGASIFRRAVKLALKGAF